MKEHQESDSGGTKRWEYPSQATLSTKNRFLAGLGREGVPNVREEEENEIQTQNPFSMCMCSLLHKKVTGLVAQNSTNLLFHIFCGSGVKAWLAGLVLQAYREPARMQHPAASWTEEAVLQPSSCRFWQNASP